MVSKGKVKISAEDKKKIIDNARRVYTHGRMAVGEEVKPRDKIMQFNIIVETRDGWLNDIVYTLSVNGNFFLGIMCERQVEFSYLRFVTESPNEVRELLRAHRIRFSEQEVIVVRIRSLNQVAGVFQSLAANEVDVLYSYELISGIFNHGGLIIRAENTEIGIGALTKNGYEILGQGDLSR